MKTLITSILFAAGVASAQSVQAHVPFNFEAAGQSMPAGDYTVSRGPGVATPTFVLQHEQTGHKIMLLALASQPDRSTASLVFDCGQRECALTLIRTGDFESHAVPKAAAPRERELKQVAVLLFRSAK